MRRLGIIGSLTIPGTGKKLGLAIWISLRILSSRISAFRRSRDHAGMLQQWIAIEPGKELKYRHLLRTKLAPEISRAITLRSQSNHKDDAVARYFLQT